MGLSLSSACGRFPNSLGSFRREREREREALISARAVFALLSIRAREPNSPFPFPLGWPEEGAENICSRRECVCERAFLLWSFISKEKMTVFQPEKGGEEEESSPLLQQSPITLRRQKILIREETPSGDVPKEFSSVDVGGKGGKERLIVVEDIDYERKSFGHLRELFSSAILEERERVEGRGAI